MSGACLWRVSVPQTVPELDLPWQQCIEWHGGLRWFWAPSSEAAHIRHAAHVSGGHATLFRAAAAQDKEVGVFTPVVGPLQPIERELRRQMDPAGIFNPGRTALEA